MQTIKKCHLCDRQFSKTEHLERHLRSHTKEKPFSCVICAKQFVRRDTLSRHIKNYHSSVSDLVTASSACSSPNSGNGAIVDLDFFDWKNNRQFIELTLEIFFERFHPVFPLWVSSNPRNKNNMAFSNPLLLALCSIGALFIGSEKATNHSLKMFEQLSRSLYDNFGSTTPSMELLQAAILTQTYNLLTGDKHEPEVENFLHERLVSWAISKTNWSSEERFISPHSKPLLHLIWLIYIQEGEMSMNSCHNHYNHRCGNKLLMGNECPSLPAASEADNKDNSLSFWLYTYASLEKLCNQINEPGMIESIEKRQDFAFQLISWYRNQRNDQLAKTTPDPFCTNILFHSLFVSMYTNLNLLEKAIGRDGADTAVLIKPQVQQWAVSEDSVRSVIHCSIIQKYLEILPVEQEPAIHLPRSIFQAAIVWYSYMIFKSPVPKPLKSSYNFPELLSLGINCNSHLRNIDKEGFIKFISLFKRLGPWRITKNYESILTTLAENLIYGTTSDCRWGG